MGHLMTRPNQGFRCAFAAAAFLVCSGAAAADEADALPSSVEAAERNAAQAYEAYLQKDYAGAVALYKKAYEAAPSADALYNMARVYDLGLRDRPLAITFYRRYVSDPEATPELIKRANERLTALRDAEIAELETRPAPAAEPRPRALEPVAPPASTPPRADEGSDWSGLKIAALASGVAGAVALGVGAGYGVSLLAEADRANRECDGDDCSAPGMAAARAAGRHARSANWGIGVGGALLAGAAVLWLLDPGAEQAESPERARLAPIAGPDELGVALSGRW